MFDRSPQRIGRGETPESRIEVPFLAAFMVLCAIGLMIAHLYLQNDSVTLAMAVSMLVFGMTVVRVDLGVYVLVMAMLLSPEIGLSSVSRGEHGLNIRYDDVLIIIIFFGVLVKVAFEGRQYLWRPNPINTGIVAYYCICVVSTLIAVRSNLGAWDRRDAFFVLLKMAEYYMIFWLVGNAMRTLDDVRRQLVFFFLVALFVSGYGLSMVGTSARIGTPFEAQGAEPNTMGGYLTLVMCIALGLLLQSRGWRKRTLFLFLSASAFVPFLFTLSRASYLGFIAALLALGVIGRKVSVIVSVILVLVLSPILMPESVKDRVNYTFQRGEGQEVVVAGKDLGIQVDKSTHERIYVWGKVWYILRIAPLLGGGVSWGKVLDSQYARVIMETGLLGIATFLFLQYLLIRTTREAYRWSTHWMARGLALGAAAATIGLIVHSLGTISFLIVRIMEPYWFLISLTVVVRDIAIEEHTRRWREAKQTQAAGV